MYQMENPWNRVCHVAQARKKGKEKRPTVSLKMNRSGTLVEWNVFSREIKPRLLLLLLVIASSSGIKERGKTRPSRL